MGNVTIRNKEDKRELTVSKQDASDFYCKRGWELVDVKADGEKADGEKADGSIETAEQLSAEEIVADQTE